MSAAAVARPGFTTIAFGTWSNRTSSFRPILPIPWLDDGTSGATGCIFDGEFQKMRLISEERATAKKSDRSKGVIMRNTQGWRIVPSNNVVSAACVIVGGTALYTSITQMTGSEDLPVLPVIAAVIATAAIVLGLVGLLSQRRQSR